MNLLATEFRCNEAVQNYQVNSPKQFFPFVQITNTFLNQRFLIVRKKRFKMFFS